jgi:hypothetical protein
MFRAGIIGGHFGQPMLMLPCHPTPPNISYNFKMLLESQMYDIKENEMLI